MEKLRSFISVIAFAKCRLVQKNSEKFSYEKFSATIQLNITLEGTAKVIHLFL
jgi:hypothetical protein